MSLFGFLKQKNVCQLLADPDDKTAVKYRHFKDLLEKNDTVLDALAALEQAYYGGEAFTIDVVRRTCLSIGKATYGMVQALNELSRGRYPSLDQSLARVLKTTLEALEPPTRHARGALVLALSAINIDGAAGLGMSVDSEVGDLGSLLGGKAANLARARNAAGLPTPDGFVLTTAAFLAFARQSGLADFIAEELAPLSPLDLPDLEARSQRMREAVLKTPFPHEMAGELACALERLAANAGDGLKLAVRSSAVGEDGVASFAGQYESVLGVDPADLEVACRQVFASKYTPRAILYRLRHGMDDADVPMAVLVLKMVHSTASGVVYTRDPSAGQEGQMRLDAVVGLGEKLVSGEALPSVFSLSRDPVAVTSTPEDAPLSESQALELGAMGLKLEQYFGAPQDVEWCLDPDGSLIIVQSRPLASQDDAAPPLESPVADIPGLQTLLSGGVAASPGAASGEVVRVEGAVPSSIPDGAILAAVNAAPELAALLDRAGGIVTAMGGAASHLASVAREMGVPALFGVPGCPGALADGQLVTLDATGRRVLIGRVEQLLTSVRTRSRIVDSPMHRRLRAVLDHIAPLTLTDPQAANFVPEGCETVHDIVRFAHETAMREMFGLCGRAEEGDVLVGRLKAQIPLMFYCVDLGGGLRENLTTCDDISADDLRSIPMRAIWRGFTHPGITWSGAIAVDARNFMSLVASSATAEVGGGALGGDSYAMLGPDYMNLSARFGYHFANIDAFCGDTASQNHIKIRFAGGAGSFSGKCLRVGFLAKVLARLGFTVDSAGDMLDASLKGTPRQQTESALDQLGRLMAISRLLDMAISGHAEIDAMADAFFNSDYDMLSKRQENPLPNFHLAIGDWVRVQEDQGAYLARQDGSNWAPGLSKSFASIMGKLSGQRYQRFLDTVEAYFYFPLAIAKGSEMEDGKASLRVRPVSGSIDQAGGLAFAVRTAGTYLVLRLNALEDNIILFAFKDGRRTELASARVPFETGQWRELAIEVQGSVVTGFVDGKPYIVHHFDEPPRGLLGMWSKADSVVEFANFQLNGLDGPKTFSM